MQSCIAAKWPSGDSRETTRETSSVLHIERYRSTLAVSHVDSSAESTCQQSQSGCSDFLDSDGSRGPISPRGRPFPAYRTAATTLHASRGLPHSRHAAQLTACFSREDRDANVLPGVDRRLGSRRIRAMRPAAAIAAAAMADPRVPAAATAAAAATASCAEPYCCDHTCNSGWICGGGCCGCGECGGPCGILGCCIFPWHDRCQWRRWRPCDLCGCNGRAVAMNRAAAMNLAVATNPVAAKSRAAAANLAAAMNRAAANRASCGAATAGVAVGCFPGFAASVARGPARHMARAANAAAASFIINDWRSQPPRCEPVQLLRQLGRPGRTDAGVSNAASRRAPARTTATYRPARCIKGPRPANRCRQWPRRPLRPRARRRQRCPLDAAAHVAASELAQLRRRAGDRPHIAYEAAGTAPSRREAVKRTPTLGAIGRPRLAAASWGRGARGPKLGALRASDAARGNFRISALLCGRSARKLNWQTPLAVHRARSLRSLALALAPRPFLPCAASTPSSKCSPPPAFAICSAIPARPSCRCATP